jgi:DNA-directed RNA polymerase
MATSKYKVLSPIDIGKGRIEPSDKPVDIDDEVAAPLVVAKAVEKVADKADEKPAKK